MDPMSGPHRRKTNHHEDHKKPAIRNRFNGREVQPAKEPWLTPERVELLKKIAAIAVIALVLCGGIAAGLCLQRSPNNVNQPCLDDEADCSTSFSPVPPTYSDSHLSQSHFTAVRVHPITEFPAYFPKVVFPGYMSGTDNDLCVIPKNKIPPFSECESTASSMHQIIKEDYPALYAKEVTAKPASTLEKGLELGLDQADDGISIQRVTIGVDARKIENYKNAVGFVEENVLKVPSFFEGSSESVQSAIVKTYQHLSFGINSAAYRTDELIVYGEIMKDGREETREETLKRNGGSPEDFKIWKGIKKKARQMGGMEHAFESLTERELKTLNKIGFLPSRVKDIEREMDDLSERIQEMALKVIDGELDPIPSAAYVHQEIGRIHPFEDGNGRLARIWANVMLQLGGIKGVIFPDAEKYIEAVTKDRGSPGTFARYLEEVIEWNRQQDVLQKESGQDSTSAA